MTEKSAVLVLDDDEKYMENLRLALSGRYHIFAAAEVTEAVKILRENLIHAIILDFHLGLDDGHTFLDLIRTDGNCPPVIVVSGVINLEMTLGFLKRQIFGFLEKPVALSELEKLLSSALTHTSAQPPKTDREFSIDHIKRKVSIHGRDAQLTPTEFEILAFFEKNKGLQVSRQAIISHLWGNRIISRHAFDTHLLNLRKKLPPFADRLVSIYGTGYCYED